MKYWNELHGQVFAIAFVAGILGNLAANALWGLPTLNHLHRKLNRHHEWHVNNASKGDS